MEYTYQQSGQPTGNGKKPVTKRWWFWVIVVILGLGVIGSIFGGGETAENDSTPSTSVTETQQPEESTPSAEPTAEPTPTPAPTPELTMAQKNALETAHSYLDYSAFSYSGLIGQLEYEGYSTEDATFAVDRCGADWNEQALKSALSYLDYSAFSYSGLIDQLEYEGFTAEQATYGVDNCKADWNEQAAKCAQSYLDYDSFSRASLIDQLEYEGFTAEQAEYGVSAVGY